jgi:hypothetical protein
MPEASFTVEVVGDLPVVGGELLLVLPAATVLCGLAITGIDRAIPNLSRLEDALAHALAASSACSSPALTGSESSPSRPRDGIQR